MTASVPFPAWFQEICFRLTSQDASLTHLNLNIRRLDHGMMKRLSEAMLNSSSLLVMNLTTSVSNDTNALCPLLVQALPVTVSLQILHLSYNHIECGTISDEIGSCLSTNKSLREIYLDYNSIGRSGAASIARGVKFNDTLRVLHLNNNSIGDEGTKAIADALKKNISLNHIGLGRNGIGQDGFMALRQVLEHSNNYALRFIHLDGNHGHLSVTNDQGPQQPNHGQWVDVFCRANRIGRSVIAQKENFALFPAVLARAAEPSSTSDSPSLVYLLLRNHLFE